MAAVEKLDRQDKSEKMVALLSQVLAATSAGMPPQLSQRTQQKQSLQAIVNKLKATSATAAIVAAGPVIQELRSTEAQDDIPDFTEPQLPASKSRVDKQLEKSRVDKQLEKNKDQENTVVVRLFESYEPIERYIAARLAETPKQKPAAKHVHVHTWLHASIMESWLRLFFGPGAFVFSTAVENCPGQRCQHLFIWHHDLLYTIVNIFVRASIKDPSQVEDNDVLATLLSVPWSKYIMSLDTFLQFEDSTERAVAKHVSMFIGLASVQAANKFLNDLGVLVGQQTWRTYVSDIRQLPVNRLSPRAQVYYGLEKRLYLALTKTYSLTIEDILV